MSAKAAHTVRALGRIWLYGCSLALAVSCTTNETDSIDLAAPSAKPPKPPMKPMPDTMPMPCMNDEDGGCSKEPMKAMPDMMPMPCMNDEDGGCPKQPMSPSKPPPP